MDDRQFDVIAGLLEKILRVQLIILSADKSRHSFQMDEEDEIVNEIKEYLNQ